MSRVKGEVSFEAGGNTFKVKYSMNALCDLEEKSGQDLGMIMERLETSPSMRDIRTTLWAGLQEHHSDTIIEPRDAGALLPIREAVPIIMEALKAAFPDAEEGAKDSGKGK